jgi:DNA-binding NarL/FixJ family response regulator
MMTESNGGRESHPFPGGRLRVFIVDDHPIVCRGLSGLIEDEPDMEVCGMASSVGEAMAALISARPDVLLVDLSLDGPSGIELISHIAARKGPIKTIVVSMHEEAMYATRALRAGASGYVKKDEAAKTVVLAVREAIAGRIYVSPTISARVLHEMIGARPDSGETLIARLSTRELAVFDLLGRGMTTRDIAKHLKCSPKTIESHRQNIKLKLGLKHASELLAYAGRHSSG